MKVSAVNFCAILACCFCLLLTASAGAAEKRILVIGDSIAAGYGLDPSEAFPALLQEKIEQSGLKWKVQNAGVSGDTSAGGVGRIDWLLKNPVDILVLELGGNDGLRGVDPESTKKNLQEIITRTKGKYPQAKIVIAGMQMPANMGAEYTRRFAAIYGELAKENKAALVPFLLEGVGGIARLNQPDRIHPTAEGHRIIAENVWKTLKPLLAAPSPSSQASAR
ncbi:MAG TPA: arylesterase [Methylomirabilota bacterium]|nr:arylesterase [Methylomirabilota bacterium]